MTYKLSIDKKPAYWHAVVVGQNCQDTVSGYMEELIRECRAGSCDRLLIEERLEGPRLDMMTIFHLVSDGSALAFGIFKAIAYVDTFANDDLMQFAETVGVNRAIPVKIFSTASEAAQWLSEA